MFSRSGCSVAQSFAEPVDCAAAKLGVIIKEVRKRRETVRTLNLIMMGSRDVAIWALGIF
jgi:hypothetical protein